MTNICINKLKWKEVGRICKISCILSGAKNSALVNEERAFEQTETANF